MSCNCGCEDSITALQGETGEAGTSVAVTTGAFSTAASAVEYVITANRLSTAANALDYDWSVVTIPAGVGAANVAIFSATAQINATGAHNVTITVIETGSGAPVAGISFEQNCGTRETVNVRFQIGNVVEGAVYAIHFATSDPTVTATLKGGNCRIDIYG